MGRIVCSPASKQLTLVSGRIGTIQLPNSYYQGDKVVVIDICKNISKRKQIIASTLYEISTVILRNKEVYLLFWYSLNLWAIFLCFSPLCLLLLTLLLLLFKFFVKNEKIYKIFFNVLWYDKFVCTFFDNLYFL